MAIRISLFRFDFFIILSTILFINEAKEYAPVVEIEAGKIRGLVQPLEGVSGGKIHFYQGIRYATANRFEKPKLVERFQEDVYDATREGYSCQTFLKGSFDLDKFHKTEKSDDCLFLNIFKPIAKTSNGDDRLLPVMVWIYGGGFQSGTIFTPIYDGSYLAAMGDVIVVAINYRLGVLGFLYAGTEDAPGNQGFYDQLTALKWVQKNIQAFGGDPNQVTIFGESAGSWSVSALVLSPLAQGLFKRAILQSGAIAPSARFSTKQDNLQKSMKFAEKIGCKTDDIGDMLKCLRSKSLEEIKEFGSVDVRQMMSNQAIQPMVGDDFLPEDSMRFRGHVNKADLLFGVTKDEGSMFVRHFVPELDDDQAKFSMEQVKEKIFEILTMYHLDKPEEVVEFYTKDLDASDLGQVRKMFSDFYGDFRFNCPVMLFGKQIAMRTGQEHQFYSYRFDRRAFAADMMQCSKWMGVCHAAEILYVFGYPQIKLFPKDYKLSQDMMGAWINFAKTGQPGQIANTEWLQAFDETLTTNRVMSLDVEYEMLQNPFKEACESLWEKKLMNWKPKLAPKQEL